MTYVSIWDYKCPFHERDLTRGHDECYSGSGANRCPYFVRYDWSEHPGCIACTHPPVTQLELFGEELCAR
jgi:hypothetical protein